MNGHIHLASKLLCSSEEQPTLACQETETLLGAVWLEDLIVGQGIPNKKQDGVVGGGAWLWTPRAVDSNIEWPLGLLCKFAKNT